MAKQEYTLLHLLTPCLPYASVEVIAKTSKRFYEDSAEVVMEVVKKLGHI